ncbi:Prostasin [Folsomia candida]|uniref:Prostasin n=1 Tax=Folsomia candida TaxID=158441 RepID=A0A226E4N3_FOLCA|nr:Prostasin [Folsomia candida]
MNPTVLIIAGALLIFGGIVKCDAYDEGVTEGNEDALVPGSKELTTGKGIDVTQHKNILLLPAEEECGFADKEDIATSMQQSGSKVFLTKPNTPSKYPWMVRVVVEDNKGVRWPVCSGTLISSRYVLTSATCLIGLNSAVKVSNIVLGGHNAHCDNGKCFPISKVVEVSDTVIHPDYVLPTRQHDIGLVKLAKSVTVTESYMRPVCLPKAETLFAGFKNNKTVSVSWGKLEEGSLASSYMLYPRNLRVTEMTFELREYCDRFYKISHAKFGPGRVTF